MTNRPERCKACLGFLLVAELERATYGDKFKRSRWRIAERKHLPVSANRGIHARARLAAIDKDLRTAEVGTQKAENEIESIKEKIAGYDTADLALKRSRSNEMLKEEGRILQDIKNVRRDIDKTNEDLAIARKAAESLAPARHRRSTMKTSLAEGLERIFSASIEQLRDKLRKRVETLASESFRQMITQKSYRGLEINENYGLSIINSTGGKVSLKKCRRGTSCRAVFD